MEKDNFTTDIMFRYDTSKDWKGIIFAILPHEIADNKGNVTTYQHIGQHSSGEYQVCIQMSRPATEIEYKDLKTELESIGYNVKVVKKQNRKKYLQLYYSQK